jgi:hypothetical protein
MPLRTISYAGVIAGILDISDAFIFYGLRGVKPIRILQGIASGLLGARAFRGGLETAALGLGLHFLIAFGAATVYYLASRKIAFMTRHAVLSGLLYGVMVYAFMNLVVLPLSNVSRAAFSLVPFINGVAAIAFCVGLPIALIVRRYSAVGVSF